MILMGKLDPHSEEACQAVCYDVVAQLLQAHFAITRGEAGNARHALQQALAQCKRAGDNSLALLHPDITGKLLQWSYEQGIEPDFVRQSMQSLQLAEPGASMAEMSSPPPIRVNCLGRFTIRVDDRSIRSQPGSRNKPLEMLKVLIALGGHQVSLDQLTQAMWPDAPGDNAKQNFNTTLHRLRRVLGYPQALRLKDGLLSLDSRYVAVDLWDTERLLGQLELLLKHRRIDQSRLRALGDRLFTLFQGDFLGNDTDRSWSLLVKERLRTRMLKIIVTLGRYWQDQQQQELACEIFEHGLTIEPLHELLYQHLMQLHITRGHYSQAAAIYEKCRKMLSTSLGIMPCDTTVALYRQTLPMYGNGEQRTG